MPIEDLDAQTNLREVGFDSLKYFQLTLEVERIVGREFSETELDIILACVTLGELCGEAEGLASLERSPASEMPRASQLANTAGADEVRKLIALSNECWVSRALHSAVELKIADYIADAPMQIGELALRTGAATEKLSAVIELLAHRGIFSVKAGVVSHTPTSQFLHSEHRDRVSQIIEWMGSDEVWATLGQMPKAMIGSATAFEAAYGTGLFAYLAQHPDRSALFDRHMSGYASRQTSAILGKCDLSEFASIADIGSGEGILANAIAARYPAARVTAFDLPGCSFSALDQTPRVRKIHGDFFVDELPEAELTILCNVLHDWPDGEASAIIARLGQANVSGTNIYVIEGLPEGREEKVAMVNLGMMVTTGGRQRTYAEYSTMLAAAGYTIYSTQECSDYLSIIKAQLG